MLNYFDDENVAAPCQFCDVCINSSSEEVGDMTGSAVDIITWTAEILGVENKVTTKLIVLVYRGHKTKDIIRKGLHVLNSFGKGKTVFKNDKSATKFIHLLISSGYLSENITSLIDSQPTTPSITVQDY